MAEHKPEKKPGRGIVGTTEALALHLVRRSRRMPRTQAAVRKVASGLRSNQLARTAISRAFDMDLEGVGGTVFIDGGNLLAGDGLDNVPVVVLSLVGVSPDLVPERLEEIGREQLLTGGFRPIIVIDGDHFAAVREYAWPVELVLSAQQWDDQPDLRDDEGWEAYLTRRYQSIRRNYRAAALLEFGPEHPLTLTYLRSLGPAAR